MRRKKKTESKTIGSILPLVAKGAGWQKKLDQHSIFEHWKKIVESEVAEHATPLKIVKDVLWIEVDNSAWVQQFQYQKLMILDSLNEFLEGIALDDIRLVVKDDRKVQEHKFPKVTFLPPEKAEIEAFESLAETISDEKTRESLVRFWYLCKACKRE